MKRSRWSFAGSPASVSGYNLGEHGNFTCRLVRVKDTPLPISSLKKSLTPSTTSPCAVATRSSFGKFYTTFEIAAAAQRLADEAAHENEPSTRCA